MKKVVILGAGLSSHALIHYLETHASAHDWDIHIAERDTDLARRRSNGTATIHSADLTDPDSIRTVVEGASLVVSMLPARLHLGVAQICLELGIDLATASYLSDEIMALDAAVRSQGLCFLNECGLDPGIDHLSAMRLLDGIRAQGGTILEFESFTGGLVAPDCEDNPWQYKFTWNPRNVVVAGQGGAVKFIQQGQYKYIPYHKVFRRTEIVEIPGYGKFEGYANRDSLKYRSTYGLDQVRTMYRGTFRRPGFSKAWNCLVQLGATDDSFVIEQSKGMTHRQFVNTFLSYHPSDSIELKLRQYLKIDQDDVDLWERLEWLGLFTEERIELERATPARILQHILEKKWSLKPDDRDMVVMWHSVIYALEGKEYRVTSSLVCEGSDQQNTAMAKTVGLPLAMACKMLLTGSHREVGCILPVKAEWYGPILDELETQGIRFNETASQAL